MPDDRIPKLLLLAGLIAVHGLFAAAETAVSALPEGKLRRQAEEGDGKARALLALCRRPERLGSAMQLVLSLCALLAAAFAADSFAPPLEGLLARAGALEVLSPRGLHDLCVAAVTLVLSFVSLVLGSLAPRRLAARRPEGVARFAAGPVRLAAGVCRPASWLLDKSANGALRLMGVDPAARPEEVSEEEIRLMVDLGEEKGAIEPTEKELIENIFAFNNTTAGDVMIHRTDMAALRADDPPERVLALIRETGLSRFPVYQEDADDIIGILSTRDYLLNTQSKRPRTLRALLRPAYFVPASVRTDVLFRDMQSRKIHIAIVVDEYGGTAGLVTMEDLLEEIVGNIYDEFDPQAEQEIVPLGEDLWRVAGCAPLEAVAQAAGVRLPEDQEYGTLGGLVFAQLSVVPEDGSKFQVEALGLRIRVEDFSDRRVEWALVSRLEEASG